MDLQAQDARFRVKLRSRDGHKCELEVRGAAGPELLERVGGLLEWAAKLGYTPTGKVKARGDDERPGPGAAQS